MNYRAICLILSKYILGFAAVLLIPLLVSLYYLYSDIPYENASVATQAFLETILVCCGVSALAFFVGSSGREDSLHRRDGILLVAMIWFITTGLASLPFVFSHTIPIRSMPILRPCPD